MAGHEGRRARSPNGPTSRATASPGLRALLGGATSTSSNAPEATRSRSTTSRWPRPLLARCCSAAGFGAGCAAIEHACRGRWCRDEASPSEASTHVKMVYQRRCRPGSAQADRGRRLVAAIDEAESGWAPRPMCTWDTRRGAVSRRGASGRRRCDAHAVGRRSLKGAGRWANAIETRVVGRVVTRPPNHFARSPTRWPGPVHTHRRLEREVRASHGGWRRSREARRFFAIDGPSMDRARPRSPQLDRQLGPATFRPIRRGDGTLFWGGDGFFEGGPIRACPAIFLGGRAPTAEA